MSNLTTISIKLLNPQKVTPYVTKTFLFDLTSISPVSSLQKLLGIRPQILSLEIVTINQNIIFLVTVNKSIESFIQTQIQRNYPFVKMQKIDDPLQGQSLYVKNFKLRNGSYYPIATYDKFADIDPMASVLSVLSKAETNEVSMVQIALEATSSSWQSKGASYADFGTKKEDGTYAPRSDKNIIVEKISYPGFKASIRVASTSNKTLTELSSALDVFTRSDGNTITTKKIGLFGRATVVDDLLERKVTGHDVMNVMEIATLWHL